jgi:hypothetical protein
MKLKEKNYPPSSNSTTYYHSGHELFAANEMVWSDRIVGQLGVKSMEGGGVGRCHVCTYMSSVVKTFTAL